MNKDYKEQNLNILLSSYDSYSFDRGECLLYFKGSIYSEKEKTDLDKWIKRIVRELSGNDNQFMPYLLSELVKISGLFSLIIKNNDKYYIAADIIRNFPVFYGWFNNEFFLTNNLDQYQNKKGTFEIDNDKLEEYIASGFVYGNGTIFKNIYAIQAGEVVSINGYEILSERYFKFKPNQNTINFKCQTDFIKSFDKILLTVFSKMFEQTPYVNRWIIPLSGGHDSRIIVNYLYRLGVKNVLCFTYGIVGNEQSNLSKQVAEALGFEWHFVEYTEQKWKALHDSGIIDEFIWYAFNGVSIPHFQDFLAINELKKRGILKPNDVFIPGHTFDFLAGSNLEPADILCVDKTMAVKRTVQMHSRIENWSSSPVKAIENIYETANLDSQHFQEYFNWQEKRAKFLVNTSRGYEFFGFDVRLPFWDKDLVDFWLMIPDKERLGRKIFFEAEKLGILVNQLISIPFFGKNDRVETSIIEKIVRILLPGFLKTLLLRISGHKAKYNAGLNQIYALCAPTVKELLKPIEDYPSQIRPYFITFLNRYPFQIDYHLLTSLYTIRKQLDRNKNQVINHVNKFDNHITCAL